MTARQSRRDQAIDALSWAAAAIEDAKRAIGTDDDRLTQAEALLRAVADEIRSGVEK